MHMAIPSDDDILYIRSRLPFSVPFSVSLSSNPSSFQRGERRERMRQRGQVYNGRHTRGKHKKWEVFGDELVAKARENGVGSVG